MLGITRRFEEGDRLKLSTKGRYGLRALIDLAQYSEDTPVSIMSISSRQELSERYLEQLMCMLKKAGLVQARSGVTGGHKLGRPASQITMLDIITCMEDHTMLGRCLDDTAKTPEQSGAIAGMQHYFLELQQVMENSMRSVTVQQLLAEQPA